MRYNSIILSACLFAVAGLVIPSYGEAEAAGQLALKTKSAGASADCPAVHGGLQADSCKHDSKSSKIDLDRKGHKVKKAKKSRGR
jgi:hypothetical protein